ncbi:MAG: glycosyltransferase family 4 protein [Gammaproteobacteria bacterium]|nr:glycosyltransferase family 4 protein [Gammaproteobacteria bacterium]
MRKNILLVANWKSDVGYAWWLMENFWVQISRLADQANKQCYLIYPVLSGLPDSVRSSSIISKEIDYSDNSLRGFIRLITFIKTNNIGCLYLTDKPYISMQYLIFRLVGVNKVIVHDHTPGHRDRPVGLKKLIKRSISFLPAVTADAMIAVSNYVKDRHLYCNCIPPEKSYVAKNGIVPIGGNTESHPSSINEFNIPSNAIIIFTSGRANQYKRIDFIIECANILINKNQLDNIYFLYCGDGPNMRDLKVLCDNYQLREKFIFAGARNDVRELAKQCHIGIQASRGEGCSLSILEYMSAGLATVLPDNPSVCASIIDYETGLVYRDTDVSSATEALRKLIFDSELRKRLGSNAERTIQSDYNLADTNKEFINIIKKIYP